VQNLLSILDDLLNWMNIICFWWILTILWDGMLPGLDYGPFGELFLPDHRLYKATQKALNNYRIFTHFGFCIVHFIALYLHKEYEVLLYMRATNVD
jgi:hypothetical protein